jgi:Flp pilus assembly CpaE family ATPase
MNSISKSYLETPFPESLTANALSIAVVGPDDTLRMAAVSALAGCHEGKVREFSSYPPGLDDLPQLLDQHHDIVMIELDSNPEYALDLVEGICSSGSSTVMIYSKRADPEITDPDLLMRCMRAGAREFLSMPFGNNSMAEALVRAAARRPPARVPSRTSGRLLVFCGAKGGAGVTAIACNFAIALARESCESTLLIDLDLPLGDVAVNLGITTDYSTIDALQSFNRLDSSFLSKILTKHSSGLSVLAAPGSYSTYRATNDAVEKLLTVARHDFENIVVDAGSKLDSAITTSHFRDATTVYLVTQSGIPELRNANRLISQCFSPDGPKLEVVLNRYESRGVRISDDDIKKALTRPAAWRIPNDYGAVRKMQDTAAPLALTDSSIFWQISQMARSACGLPEIPQKKKGFSLKGLGRSASPKGPISDESPSILRLGLITGQEPEESLAAGSIGRVDSKRGAFEDGTVFEEFGEPEIRSYNGDKYIRVADGRWHLQEALAGGLTDEIPSLEWPSSDPIPYGTALSADQLNVTASVPGHYSFTPSEGYVLPAGAHTLWVTFAPEGGVRNVTAQASVVLTVTKATPVITWPRPSAISCGTPLSATQLNATTSVPGTFEYIPGEGDIPSVGIQSLLVAFNPTDTANYVAAQAEVSLTVTKAATTITWPTPAAIYYGTPLSSAQLNATASVSGTLTYSPADGSVVAAGRHTLSVVFTPTDSTNHTGAKAEVTIVVAKAVPAITWPTPHAISYGVPLSREELNATSSVAGTFVYIPGEGAVLAAGKHTPSAVFTPAETSNYTPAHAAASLIVTKAVPAITWLTPEPMSYGSPLSDSELNATASVPGTFTYNPAAGATLTEGKHTLTVTFTPIDIANFAPASASVALTVTKPTPIALVWQTPAAISYGTPLSAAQLNTTASVTGRFVYTPSEGNILTSGKQIISVTFTPADCNLPAAHASVELIVTKAKPIITWLTPRAVVYGTPLNAAQLNAVASVAGTFAYNPDDGGVLKAGIQRLLVTFTPADTTNYEAAQAEVSLTVTKATPTILWPSPAAIDYGTPLGTNQLNAATSVSGRFVYAPASGTVLPAGTQTLSVSFAPGDTTNYTTAQAAVSILVNELSNISFLQSSEVSVDSGDSSPILQAIDVSFASQRPPTEEKKESRILPMVNLITPKQQAKLAASDKTDQSNGKREVSEMGGTSHRENEPETRTYKGAIYRKGADGQWHLQQK